MNIEHPVMPGGSIPTAATMGPTNGPSAKSDRDLLNAYIYDYLLKHNLRETAKVFNKEVDIAAFNWSPPSRNVTPLDDKFLTGDQSPNRKKDDMNGINDSPQGFLYEWWVLFWDMYCARGSKGGGSQAAQQYVQGTMRLRQEQAVRAAQVQQNAMSAMQANQMMNNPNFAAAAAAAQNAQGVRMFKQNPGGGPPIIHMENMSEAEKRNQLARQAMINSRRIPSGMMPNNNQQLQAQMLNKQQQQQFFQQQQQQNSQNSHQAPLPNHQPAIGDLEGNAGHSHSPTPQNSNSPSKRIRLSPDSSYSQVPNGNTSRPMSAEGHMSPQQMQQQQQSQHHQQQPSQDLQQQHPQHPSQSQQQMIMTPNQMNPNFNAQMMQQLKTQAGSPNQQFPQYSNALVGNQQRAMLNAVGQKMPPQGVVPPGTGAGPVPSPMVHQDGSQPNLFQGDGFGAPNRIGQPGQTQHAGVGNVNALQDYQSQLILLEQQNKRRLMVARQEQQDSNVKPLENGAPVPNGQVSAGPGGGQFVKQVPSGNGARPGTAGSPSSTSNTTTPNGDINRRATPKIANQPAPSPPDGQKGSPGNFNGSVPMDFNVMVGGPNGPMMRPGMGPGVVANRQHMVWQPSQPGQPMQPGQQQPGQSQPGQPGQPQSQTQGQNGPQQQQQQQQQQQPNQAAQSQRSMPPPQGTVVGSVTGGPATAAVSNRVQPSSPSLANPPTPTQASRQLKNVKKEARDTKKRGKKGSAAPATPVASEPQTPTTPVTPHNPPGAFNVGQNNNNNSNNNNNNASNTNNGKGGANQQSLLSKAATFAGPVGANSGKSQDNNPTSGGEGNSFIDNETTSFFNDFTTSTEAEIGDIDFDFNSFLNTDEGSNNGLNFDSGAGFNWTESVEASNDA